MKIQDYRLRHNRGKNHDGGDPEVEGHDRNFHRQDELLAGLPFIREAEEPGGEERSEEERSDAREDEQESRKESHVRCGVDERESSRNDDCRGEIREEGEGSEVLNGAAHFACDDGGCRRRGHDKTHEDSLRENLISGPIHERKVRGEGEEELNEQNDPMPFMKAQVEGVHLAKGEEKHKKDEPRKCGRQRQEEFIAKGSDEHREPEGVGVNEFTHFIKRKKQIFIHCPIGQRWSP